MQKISFLKLGARIFILLSATALLSVSLMAFANPQSVMDLVGVKLTNTDAFSSIRGVYGGVGLALFLALVNMMHRNIINGLAFLSLLWGLYAFSRLITIFLEGPLGTFGTQWLKIEATLCLAALTLLVACSRTSFIRTSLK